MKNCQVILATLLFIFIFSTVSYGQVPPIISGEQGYKINDDIVACPRFMVKLYLDLSGQSNVSISKVTFDVEYSTPGVTLPYRMVAQGTRYPNESFTVGDGLSAYDVLQLEARVKWWTFPNDVLKQYDKEIINVTFLVGKGNPITWPYRFNYVQLYFDFLRAGAFKIGDVMPIYIKNVHAYVNGSSNYTALPDFTVYVKFTSLTGVYEFVSAETYELGPNPAKEIINLSNPLADGQLKISAVNTIGQETILFNGCSANKQKHQLDISLLPVGTYFILFNDKQSTKFVVNR